MGGKKCLASLRGLDVLNIFMFLSPLSDNYGYRSSGDRFQEPYERQDLIFFGNLIFLFLPKTSYTLSVKAVCMLNTFFYFIDISDVKNL